MPLLHSQIRQFRRRRLISDRRHSTLIPTSKDANLPALVSRLVLAHPSTASSLAAALSSLPPLPPSAVDAVLKLLWNDGPRALLFFRSLLLRLPSRPPAPSSFDLATDIAARLRDPRPLRLLLSARRSAALPLSPRTFSLLAERFASAGKPDRAVRLFLSLHRHGCPRDLRVLNSLLDALCKSRRVRKAASLLRSFEPRFGADAVTFNILAEGWCRVGRTAEALEVLREMVDSGRVPTLVTYNILLKGFFRAGQVREGWEFFRQMKRRGRRKEGIGCWPDVVSYTTVVHGLGIAGEVESARKVFDGMIDEGCLPSVATYNALMQVICKKDGVGSALAVFDEMLRRGYTPNATTYTVVIRGLCHGGEMGRAMEFMERMRREGCEPVVQTYNVVIRHWCEEGEVEKALEILEGMKRGGSCLPNLDTYNVVISNMFTRKRAEDMAVAGRMVVEMVERGYLPRRFMFKKVLNGLLITGNQEFARELLRMQDRFGCLRREIRM